MKRGAQPARGLFRPRRTVWRALLKFGNPPDLESNELPALATYRLGARALSSFPDLIA